LTTEKFKSDVAALRLNKDLKTLMMANNGKKKKIRFGQRSHQSLTVYSVENQKVGGQKLCKLSTYIIYLIVVIHYDTT
jgi:hypothetical protein